MLVSRKQTEFYLKDLETPIGKAINLTLMVLVLLSSGMFVAETYNIPEDILIDLNVLDIVILIFFAGEYAVRLWSAENKFNYIFSFYATIDLIAILTFFIYSLFI